MQRKRKIDDSMAALYIGAERSDFDIEKTK